MGSEWWEGKAPTTQLSGYTPWIKAPSYDFSSALMSYMTSLIGQKAPQMPGGNRMISKIANQPAGPAMGPELSNMMSLGKQYMNTGMPTVFGAGIGSLGRFLAPQFNNPVARLQLGGPNYFGPNATPPIPGAFNPGPPPWMPQGGPPGGGMPQMPPMAGPSQGLKYDPNMQPGMMY